MKNTFIILKQHTMTRLRQNKSFRIFVFNTFTAFVTLATVYLSYLAWLDWEIAIVSSIFLIPTFAALSKFINVYFFNDIGVAKNK